MHIFEYAITESPDLVVTKCTVSELALCICLLHFRMVEGYSWSRFTGVREEHFKLDKMHLTTREGS